MVLSPLLCYAPYLLLSWTTLIFSKNISMKESNIKSVEVIPSSCYFLAKLFNFYGSIVHGYEIIGLENIPKNGPAILIMYHGAIAFDHLYLWSKLIFLGRNMKVAADKSIYIYSKGNFKF